MALYNNRDAVFDGSYSMFSSIINVECLDCEDSDNPVFLPIFSFMSLDRWSREAAESIRGYEDYLKNNPDALAPKVESKDKDRP